MLIKRFFTTWLEERRAARRALNTVDNDGSPLDDRVEQLPGFNKLVRGRHGLYIANENDTFIGRALIRYGEYSELEWKLLQRYCEPGAVVVEVGANIGAHTVSAGKAVGPLGQVVAVEPQPLIFQALCANLALNCLTNVEAINCGCGSRRQILHLPRIDYAAEGNFGAVELQGHAATASTVPIEIRKLDDVLAPYKAVRLLKIDVEGMESDVIQGGRKAIGAFHPVMYVENDRPEKSKMLVELIRALGYRMWWHIPRLFNPDNYFANAHDLYPQVGTFNMLCIHGEATPDGEGLTEIVDGADHPLAQ